MKRTAKSSLPPLIALFTILVSGSAVATLSHRSPTRESDAVTLTVQILPTSDGINRTGLFAEKYPKVIEVKDAAAFADRIAAYGAAYHVWIAPKGWTGSAAIGADASTLVTLYPVSGSAKSGPRFRYENAGGCAGCALQEAAPYFQNAMQDWKRSFGDVGPPHALPRDTKLIPVSSTLVMYSLPDGNGLLGRGAAYFVPPSEYIFERAEFRLPDTDAKLLKFLVNTAVSQQKWK